MTQCVKNDFATDLAAADLSGTVQKSLEYRFDITRKY